MVYIVKHAPVLIRMRVLCKFIPEYSGSVMRATYLQVLSFRAAHFVHGWTSLGDRVPDRRLTVCLLTFCFIICNITGTCFP